MKSSKINRSIKVVIINRAVPGSGKSSLAKRIKDRFQKEGLTAAIFSTDDYFLSEDGRYIFEPMKLAEYHQKNLQAFTEELKRASNLVICDNTNLSPWEAEQYSNKAREYDYKIILIDYPPRKLEEHLEAQKVTAEKPDAHQVPEETLKDMKIAYYKYWKHLQKNYKVIDGIDVKCVFNQETLQLEKTNETIRNYEYDKLITIQPDKYHEEKEELPQKIFKEAFLLEGGGDFDEKVAYWQELIKNDKNAADTYRHEYLLPEMTAILAEKTAENCEVLISLLGFSPETTILATAALKCKKLVVLTSKDLKAESHYNTLYNYLTSHDMLKPADIIRHTIDISSIQDIYNVVEVEIKNAQGKELAVDLTGGTKPMSVATALMAWEVNARLYYIDSDSKTDNNLPMPGAAFLRDLANPSKSRGRIIRKNAIRIWDKRVFNLAKEQFEESNKILGYDNFEKIALPLCDFYEALYAFDFTKMEKIIFQLEELKSLVYLKPFLKKINFDSLLKLFQNDPKLNEPKNRIAVLLSMSAEYAKQRRLDFATMLSYRAIEDMVLERLKAIAKPGFELSEPDYKLLYEEPEKLRKDSYALWQKAMGKNGLENKELPPKIGLVAGFVMLLVLEEEHKYDKIITCNEKSTRPKWSILKSFGGICEYRNKSILAHGRKNIKEEEFNKIFQVAEDLGSIILGESLKKLVETVTPPDLEKILP